MLDKTIHSIARKAAISKRGEFIDYVREGWNSYSFIFYIGGVSAILGSLFGIAGWLSVIVTVAFFYYAGKFVHMVRSERERLGKGGKKARIASVVKEVKKVKKP